MDNKFPAGLHKLCRHSNFYSDASKSCRTEKRHFYFAQFVYTTFCLFRIADVRDLWIWKGAIILKRGHPFWIIFLGVADADDASLLRSLASHNSCDALFLTFWNSRVDWAHTCDFWPPLMFWRILLPLFITLNENCDFAIWTRVFIAYVLHIWMFFFSFHCWMKLHMLKYIFRKMYFKTIKYSYLRLEACFFKLQFGMHKFPANSLFTSTDKLSLFNFIVFEFTKHSE